MKIGSLFSGYGGLDLAVSQVLDAEPAWFVEYDKAPSTILQHHWPDVPNYGDVTQVDWNNIPPVDILTGGYPCQPFSQAGRRKGTNDERHLWPYVREAIRILRPRFALLENVAGHRSLGLDTVLADLAEDGADVWWTSLRASDIGAPHHRERLFILVAPDPSRIRPGELLEPLLAGVPPAAGGSRPDSPADPHGVGVEEGGQPLAGPPQQPRVDDSERPLPDTIRTGRIERRGAAPGQAAGGRTHGEPDRCGDGVRWGQYAPAVRRWERVVGPAPAPTELNRNGKPRLNAAFAEWMMGLPLGHVTDVPGLTRAGQLKAIGNGVCPQQGAVALRELLTMMEEAI